MKKNKIKIAVSFAIVAVVLIWITVSGFNENMRYYVEIPDVKAMETAELSKGLRVKGYLVPGSLEKKENSLEVKFVIEDRGEELQVRYAKELPDTFKDGSEVLVEGQYTEDGYFDAKTLMAKCPSKYETDDQYNMPTAESGSYQNVDGTN